MFQKQMSPIEIFLDARANDSDSFFFTPPGESSSSEFVCESGNKLYHIIMGLQFKFPFRKSI
ncbi:MAG: hypothetical protein CM15mV71_470 [Caudoviricetes sp.]|nr:MAG: hypothetical protein CM15mV71_470 [Caudoviricetes sp.]